MRPQRCGGPHIAYDIGPSEATFVIFGPQDACGAMIDRPKFSGIAIYLGRGGVVPRLMILRPIA